MNHLAMFIEGYDHDPREILRDPGDQVFLPATLAALALLVVFLQSGHGEPHDDGDVLPRLPRSPEGSGTRPDAPICDRARLVHAGSSPGYNTLRSAVVIGGQRDPLRAGAWFNQLTKPTRRPPPFLGLRRVRW